MLLRLRIFLVCAIVTLFAFSDPCFSQEPSAELIRLRQEWATRFLEPDPHMLLARYFRDNGNPLQAFYILENARRGRFETEVFDAAFLKYFGGGEPLDNSKTAENEYLARRKAFPDDLKATRHLADIYISRDDFARAEPLLKLVVEKDSKDFGSVSALAKIYRRQKNADAERRVLTAFETKYPTEAGSYSLRIGREWGSDPKKARSLINEAIARYPSDGEFWSNLGSLDQKENRLDEAEANFVKAAGLEPNSVNIQGQAAFFFYRIKPDPERALKYYLNTYLLDPHAHYGGFAEANIPKLNIQLATARFDSLLRSGKAAKDLLTDANPVVVHHAAATIAKTWDTRSADIFIRLMAHDEVLVRWYAMEAIVENEGSAFTGRLAELLNHTDLRIRGLAAYMAVRLLKEGSVPEMKKMLNSNIQVLRFDALSALALYGGVEGKKIIQEHYKMEKSEYLRKLIQSVNKP